MNYSENKESIQQEVSIFAMIYEYHFDRHIKSY